MQLENSLLVKPVKCVKPRKDSHEQAVDKLMIKAQTHAGESGRALEGVGRKETETLKLSQRGIPVNSEFLCLKRRDVLN